MDLFGGTRGWHADDWTASDDRVRGGKSQSYLRLDDPVDGSQRRATFCGNLDFDTLGGAGFASQRTTGDDRDWDLAGFDGIEVTIDQAKSDNNRYTFILKDQLLPTDPDNGREQATVSWEFEFRASPSSLKKSTREQTSFYIPWNAFEPTYRGRKQKQQHDLKFQNIRRMSVMMRSYFGAQKGDFRLCLIRIAAVKQPKAPPKLDMRNSITNSEEALVTSKGRPPSADTESHTAQSVWSRLFGVCCHL